MKLPRVSGWLLVCFYVVAKGSRWVLTYYVVAKYVAMKLPRGSG